MDLLKRLLRYSYYMDLSNLLNKSIGLLENRFNMRSLWKIRLYCVFTKKYKNAFKFFLFLQFTGFYCFTFEVTLQHCQTQKWKKCLGWFRRGNGKFSNFIEKSETEAETGETGNDKNWAQNVPRMRMGVKKSSLTWQTSFGNAWNSSASGIEFAIKNELWRVQKSVDLDLM